MSKKINAQIINLKKDEKRYEDMTKKLDDLSFCNYKRFDAVVGSEVLSKLVQEDKIYKRNNRIFLNNHMVGCWQSHLTIWQEIVDNSMAQLLIFEDDCIFKENFTEKFYKTMELIKDREFDILYLGYSGTNPVFDKELHLISHGYPRTTHCYILTLSGAKKLVNKLSRINFPIDELMGQMFNNKKLKGYRTSELLVWQPWQWSKMKIRNKYFNC